jgi:hypothetical protein
MVLLALQHAGAWMVAQGQGAQQYETALEALRQAVPEILAARAPL